MVFATLSSAQERSFTMRIRSRLLTLVLAAWVPAVAGTITYVTLVAN